MRAALLAKTRAVPLVLRRNSASDPVPVAAIPPDRTLKQSEKYAKLPAKIKLSIFIG